MSIAVKEVSYQYDRLRDIALAAMSRIEKTYGLTKRQQCDLWEIVSRMPKKDRSSTWVYSLLNGKNYREIERKTNEENPPGLSAFERRLAQIEGRTIEEKASQVKFVPFSLQKRMAREFVQKHILFTGNFASVFAQMKTFETALVKAFQLWCEEK